MVKGLHHVTALARDFQKLLNFYGGVLGLHLVKRTVNFDDPHTSHVFFGAHNGEVGTLLSFLIFPKCHRAVYGQGLLESVSLGVASGSLSHWRQKLKRYGPVMAMCFERESLSFQDPDGLRLELVEVERAREGICGLQGIRFSCPEPQTFSEFWQESLGLKAVGEQGDLTRLNCGSHWMDLRYAPQAKSGALGYGAFHHPAFSWIGELDAANLKDASPTFDRYYFRSRYFYEPAGALCELATEGPGLSFDEGPDSLGKQLMLPPHLEARRKEIEEVVK